MKHFKLIRVAYIADGTFGVLFDEEIPFCLTVEREWKGNQRNISCIPTGYYLCKRVQSPKFGDTFEICDVPGRSHILFHMGNIEDDSHGCVITGEEYGKYKGKVAVASSGRAFAEFKYRLRNVDSFYLDIDDAKKS